MPTIYGSDFPMKSTLQAGKNYRIVIETPSRFALVSDSASNKDIVESRNGRIVIQSSYPRRRMGVYQAPLKAKDAYSQSYDGFLAHPVE